MNSDARLGFGVYSYQSAEDPFNSVATRDDVLVRIEGLRCKGRYDKQNICQKVKVGFCPFCSTPTHVAIPTSYRLGEYDDRKLQAIDLRAQFGPWGPRRFCALKYSYESNNREPLPTGWDWAANSLRNAFPPPLIRGNRMGPPTEITTIGEARKARRQKFLGDRAREEVCPVRPVQGNTPETIKGEVNPVVNVTPSTTTNERGTGKSVPQTTANPPISSNGAKKANPKAKYLDQYFVAKGKNPFVLAEAVPEPTKEESSNTSESWRGFRHPKEPPATQQAKWDGTGNWPS